jgi:hypothetical protein
VSLARTLQDEFSAALVDVDVTDDDKQVMLSQFLAALASSPETLTDGDRRSLRGAAVDEACRAELVQAADVQLLQLTFHNSLNVNQAKQRLTDLLRASTAPEAEVAAEGEAIAEDEFALPARRHSTGINYLKLTGKALDRCGNLLLKYPGLWVAKGSSCILELLPCHVPVGYVAGYLAPDVMGFIAKPQAMLAPFAMQLVGKSFVVLASAAELETNKDELFDLLEVATFSAMNDDKFRKNLRELIDERKEAGKAYALCLELLNSPV